MEVLQNFKNLFFDVWTKGISGVNISEIIIALLIFILFLFLRGVFSKFVVKRLENYVSKTTNSFDNSLVFSMEGPAKFFPVVLGFFVSTSYLTVETQAAEFLETINRSLITILIFWTFHQIIGPLSAVIKSVGGLLSKDLINWKHHGTVFTPSNNENFDDYTIWTGSIIKNTNKWHYFYTGRNKKENGSKSMVHMIM